MRLRLSRPAARQLEGILDYISDRSPGGAETVQARLQNVMMMLCDHPHAGHMTRRPGVRRVLALPYRYAVTYRVRDEEVIVLGVRHTSRRPQG